MKYMLLAICLCLTLALGCDGNDVQAGNCHGHVSGFGFSGVRTVTTASPFFFGVQHHHFVPSRQIVVLNQGGVGAAASIGNQGQVLNAQNFRVLRNIQGPFGGSRTVIRQ